jgi:cyclic beta-1,2-glucan synthetase
LRVSAAGTQRCSNCKPSITADQKLLQMPQNTHIEIISSEAQRLPELAREAWDLDVLRAKAQQLASRLTCLPDVHSSRTVVQRWKRVAAEFKPLLSALDSPPAEAPASDDLRWLYENIRLLHTELQATVETLKPLKKMPHVRTEKGETLPRILAIGGAFLEAASYQFSEQKFTVFVEAFQETTVLESRELWALTSTLKLLLLEQIAARGSHFLRGAGSEPRGIGICVRSLRDIGHATWKEVVEPLILFDRVLREDPAGCYSQMDFESRDLYRHKLSNIAQHSDFTEVEVAKAALDLAREASQRSHASSRERIRTSHIGYYLADHGVALLHARVGFRCPLQQRIESKLRKFPDAWFLLGIGMLTCAITSAILLTIPGPAGSFGLVLLSLMALLLPISQSAVQLMNHLTTSLLTAEILPKLDFSEGIPANCLTMVAIPSLLFSEEQVHGLVEDLEVRFLGNHDPHIHFALLTDLPDSHEPAQEDSPLLDLCAELIQELNERYAGQRMGSFFLFHRHRVYNPREKAWMGWERKRGKLLDLNGLLRGHHDSFPVKVGDLRILPRVRFVITLDSDTELPRGSAQRMVGTLAHPLNSAIVDPEKNIVVAGYGILQPRVGVSVQSTARSRLAAIYAGETGLDIYTRAISDAYQDLYREGIYTGKGIYEVDVVQQIFDRRFPRNALLSHDLIEGAYARAGLVSDIEVIEDYPSHYSAYNRRKHRWLRGDWQIVEWLLPRVPEESGARVKNPISLISRWKIFDNLRRSLVEPATFLLLVFGWLMFSGTAAQWTLATICILFIPACFQFLLHLSRALWARNGIAAREALTALYTSSVNLFFTLTFLAHQTLLSLDAVLRALVRRLVTHRLLLEWETAAETELGQRRPTPIDVYLDWMPVLAFGLGILVLLVRPRALAAALPLLLLWGSSKLISVWLNRPSVAPLESPSGKDLVFLRNSALHTWRYFSEFSTEEHNWLIPDNVQEQPPAIAARISPTNLGLLLNARQVASEFGYLTLPEFAEQTLRTLATVSGLRKYRGHLFNWYDTRTLQPLAPWFVSSVDSGNLMASLWTLQQGCRERLRKPLLQSCLLEGFVDCVRALENSGLFSRKQLGTHDWDVATDGWLEWLMSLPETTFDGARHGSKDVPDMRWFVEQAASRIQAIRQTLQSYAPWCLPEFAALRNEPPINLMPIDKMSLELLPDFIDQLENGLTRVAHSLSSEQQLLCERLRSLLPEARRNVSRLVKDVRIIANEAGRLADEMDFAFLLNRRRKLMSVGFDGGSRQLHPACYDLLGTESRTAIFVAVAKGDIPQQSWFLLGRAHTLDQGRPIMLSWTGTLFEYLMPSLWMRSYPRTLLERSRVAAVRSQQAYSANRGVPWGISESAHIQLDEAGNYQYHAFGLPHLAQRKPEVNALVISPYSTFLALATDPSGAIRNLRRMAGMGWLGGYGFYESADYGSARHRFWQHPYQLVRCWMAHHQGMSLLALANFLKGNVVQHWFHSDRRVQATELLLQEKPVAHIRRRDLPRKMAAA